MSARLLTQRKSARKPVMVEAICRSASGRREKVLLSDISAEGCRMSTEGMLLSIGKIVGLRIKSFEGFTGKVCWVTRDHAGIEFDRPLYGPVLDHLANLYRRQARP